MTKTKHAPWVAYKHGDLASGNWKWAVGVPDATGGHINIATVNSLNPFNGHRPSEEIANELAAAPDMVGALRRIALELSLLPESREEGTKIHYCLSLADDAVAKSEGEAP